MSYTTFREDRKHGTSDFPFAFYDVNPQHPRYNMRYHWHTEYEIIHVMKGKFELTVDDREYTLSSGDSALVGSGMLHGGYPSDCHYQVLVFDMEKLIHDNPIFHEELKSFITVSCFINEYFPARQEDLSNAIATLLQPFLARKNGYKLAVISAWFNLIEKILSEPSYTANFYIESSNQKKILKLKSALQFISNNFREKISLDDIAAKADMNTNYFCKVFKEVTHKSPMDYLNCYRIEMACEQLLMGNKNITDVALNCGFNDTSYFVKVFRKYKNTTPGNYPKVDIARKTSPARGIYDYEI